MPRAASSAPHRSPQPWGHGLPCRQQGNAGTPSWPPLAIPTNRASHTPAARSRGSPEAAASRATSLDHRSSTSPTSPSRLFGLRYRLPLATPARAATSSIVSSRPPLLHEEHRHRVHDRPLPPRTRPLTERSASLGTAFSRCGAHATSSPLPCRCIPPVYGRIPQYHGNDGSTASARKTTAR